MATQNRLDAIVREGQRLIDFARGAPGRIVPQYPTWTLTDLTMHVATIHARTAEICRTLPPERIDFADLARGDDPFGLAETSLTTMVEVLSQADPDAAVWTVGSDQRVRFWERRMLIETGVHRWDAQSTVGTADPLLLIVASDGLDEFTDFYLGRLGDVPTIEVVATDLERSWRYGEGEPVDVVRGTASELFLRLMSRPGTPFPPAWERAVDGLASPADP